MLDNFVTRALLAGIGVALITGAAGCFVVWRRLACFGETIAHSELFFCKLHLPFWWMFPWWLAFGHLLAAIIAVAIKIVGVLFTVALLVIPSAMVRLLSRSPEAMAVLAAASGVVAATVGLWASA